MIRVWFNHWFSTSYGLIELIKQDEETIYVVGSNLQADSVIQKVCDEWYVEPALTGEEYINYCVTFCKEHRIDVFIPRREMIEISKYKQRFEEIGVKVLLDDYAMIEILNDKAATYEVLKDCKNLHIPDYAIVNTVEEFDMAYQKLHAKYEQICIKFVQDEGGKSFRRVVEQIDDFERLRSYPKMNITYENLQEILSNAGNFDDLLIMPYLPDNEISVDCLKTEDGLIAIPRNKGPFRHEQIEYNEEILEMVSTIMDKINLQCPCNVQFKIKDQIPYLLEINPRMSGGLQMSCLAAKVNIPNIALHKLLGKSVSWTIDKTEKVVSFIEMPKIIR